MKIEMLGDRLLVRVLKAADRTTGGLWIPEMAIDGTPWLRAEIIAAGPGSYTAQGVLMPMQVKIGDVIVFFRSAASGEQLIVPDDDGVELLCIRQQNVLGKLLELDKVTSLLAPSGERLVLQ